MIDRDSYTTFVNFHMAEMLGRHLFTFMNGRGIVICKRNLKRRTKGIREQYEFEFLGRSCYDRRDHKV